MGISVVLYFWVAAKGSHVPSGDVKKQAEFMLLKHNLLKEPPGKHSQPHKIELWHNILVFV